jgi:PAS domain S-box-containing protein
VVLGTGGAAVAALAGERFGLYDRATALALPVVLGILAAAVVVTRQSLQIDQLVGDLRSAADAQRDLVRHAADAIFVADLEGRYIEVNESACSLLGYEKKDLLGKTIVDLIPSEDVVRLAATKSNLLEGREHLAEWTLRSRTGEWIPVELTARILPDKRWLAIARDIRPRREAEERAARERAWLRAVIEQMPEGALLTDATGRVVLENRALASLARGPSGRSDLFGNPVRYDLRDVNGVPVPPERFPIARVLRDGETVEAQEYLAGQNDGHLVPIAVSATPVRAADGTFLGIVVLLRNLTTLKQLERLRDEWASLVAHDLRQPIATIQITADMLASVGERMTAEARAQAAIRIVGSASRLSVMADDLLDVSRLEAKRMTIRKREIDLLPFLKETLARSASVTRGYPLELETSGSLSPFSADPARLEQILGNLLSNAVKYGEPGKPIRIRATGAQDRIEISVTNHGQGIAPEELPLLFDRFHRTGKAEASDVEGLGLGLYVCRGLVEAHGGSIHAESEPGDTTTFRIVFPRRPPATDTATADGTHAD